jgi:hypothetical protein
VNATAVPRTDPIPFAGGVLDEYRHVCAFFNNADEEHRVLQPFVKEGLAKGEKAFHIVDPKQREDYIARLERGGVDARRAIENGQFELKTWDQAYLRGGRFSQDAMLALIEDVLRGGTASGYPLTRLVAHMEWALEDFPGVNDLVEYETRLNYVLPRYKDPVI